MFINNTQKLARRAFMQRMGHLSLAGVAAPWALNLASMGEAAAFTATDYKALVCIFLYGGNDFGNTIVPIDATNYASYHKIRVGIATAQAALANTAMTPLASAAPLPYGLQYALAPELLPLKSLFDTGKLAVQLNVGTLVQPTTLAQYNAKSVALPPKLFSHNDQQSVWQSSKPEGSVQGWGGRIGDMVLSNNGNSLFSCVSVTGNSVFLAGQTALQYQLSTTGAIPVAGIKNPLYGSSVASAALNTLMTQPRSQTLENEYNTISKRSIGAEGTVNTALGKVGPFATANFNIANPLAMQLQTVAKMIAARNELGAKRQVFFVSLGGFDNHDFLVNNHPGLLANVADAMASFYRATEDLNIANAVTTFTASDFGRTFASNGDGSDHGWGSHHFVLGGAVKGQQFYGTAPQVSITSDDQVGQGRLLPSTSVDQYAATLATWFGVTDTELRLVVPNIINYSQQNMGFV